MIRPFIGISVVLIDIDVWREKAIPAVYAWEAKPDETFLAIETSKIIARTHAIRAYIDKKRKTG
jgi:hypothetical protein